MALSLQQKREPPLEVAMLIEKMMMFAGRAVIGYDRRKPAKRDWCQTSQGIWDQFDIIDQRCSDLRRWRSGPPAATWSICNLFSTEAASLRLAVLKRSGCCKRYTWRVRPPIKRALEPAWELHKIRNMLSVVEGRSDQQISTSARANIDGSNTLSCPYRFNPMRIFVATISTVGFGCFPWFCTTCSNKLIFQPDFIHLIEVATLAAILLLKTY